MTVTGTEPSARDGQRARTPLTSSGIRASMVHGLRPWRRRMVSVWTTGQGEVIGKCWRVSGTEVSMVSMIRGMATGSTPPAPSRHAAAAAGAASACGGVSFARPRGAAGAARLARSSGGQRSHTAEHPELVGCPVESWSTGFGSAAQDVDALAAQQRFALGPAICGLIQIGLWSFLDAYH